MNSFGRHPKYRPDIDGLRAIAVLLVVFFHAFPGRIPGGFVGVDVFFVISGYLISTIIFSNLERGSFSILEFYNRRIRRIFPALLLVMFCSLSFGWLTLFGDEYVQLAKHTVGGAAFISNFIFYNESGYFDNSSITKPMLHLWSLAIEEQFYIFWPLMLAIVWKRKWSFARLTAVIAILSFSTNIYLADHFPPAAFYWPIARFWELMIGGLLAYISLHRPEYLEKWSNLRSILGVILISVGAELINPKAAFPGWWALMPTIGAFFVISAGPKGWLNKHVLSAPSLVWIGAISYPLYLWHWPILSFIRVIEGSLNDRLTRLVAIGASICLAWLTYRFVEKPIRLKGSYRSVFALAVAMLIIIAISLGITGLHGIPSRITMSHSTFNAAVAEQFSGPIWNYTNNKTCLRRFPMRGSDNYAWWFCMLEKDQPPTFILIGNSYANQLYPGLINRPELAHQNFISIGTCDPARVGNIVYDAIPKGSPCYGDRAAAQERFIDSIILTNRSIKYAILDGLDNSPDVSYIGRLKERIDFLEANGVRVIVFVPHLRVDFDIRQCFNRPLFPATKTCTVPLSLRENLDSHFKPLIDSLRESNPKVLFFDQNVLFCSDKDCNLLLDGLPLYRDEEHHISEFGSDRLSRYFVTFLQRKLPESLR